MVKITNGVNVFEVTRGAFEGIYSHQGYTLVDEQKEENGQELSSKQKEKSEDEIFCEELVTKPISNWNKEEVKRFAAINEIDITGTKNANEAKAIIKDFLDAE